MIHHERFYISVGLFIVGALLLTSVGTFFLYYQYLHGKVESYVMFFKGSLNGLDVTSPITYRGVKIGQVRRIELTVDKTSTNVAIPVYVTFFVEKSFVQQGNPIQILIENGVVATISSPNILTGTASIELVQGHRTNRQLFPTFHGYFMFPTGKAVEEDVDAIANDTLHAARKTLMDISRFINSKELKETVSSVNKMAESFNHLAEGLDNQFPGTLLFIHSGLKQFIEATYSFHNLMDYLSRHPEALLSGRS